MDKKSGNYDVSTELVPLQKSSIEAVTNVIQLTKKMDHVEVNGANVTNGNANPPVNPNGNNLRTQQRKMGPSECKMLILLSLGVIIMAFGITGGIMWRALSQGMISRELILSPTSKSFSIWKETPIDMYLKVYLFHWTNPELFGKEKPHFIEKGPYVFKEVDYKVNRTWNANDTITFQQKRIWHFVESQSGGSLDDEIVNLNPIVASVGYRLRHKSRLAKLAASGLLEALSEKFTIKKTARQLLFDGYNDELIDKAEILHIPGIPWDKFGWFYSRNGSDSYDGTFNMNTGAASMDELGILRQWNYNDKSQIYPENCGLLNGSLGDLWPPVRNLDFASVFAPDVCTLLTLKDNGTVDYDGLEGKKFVSTAETFDNGTKVKSRECYCKGIECQPSGTLNVSTCKFGAPAFVSLPHFHLADESYVNAIDGMKPVDDDTHEFSIVVEPDFGIPLQVRARLQINLLVQPIEHLRLFENVPKVFIPMLWFRQEADLSSDLKSQIKFLIILPTLGHVTLYGIAGIGLILFVLGTIIGIRERRKLDDNQRLIGKTDNGTSSDG